MSQVDARSLSQGSLSSDMTIFDINVEKDTIALLRALHRSTVNQEAKNQLRDVLFTYVQKGAGADASSVIEIFSRFGFSVAAEPKDAAIQTGMVKTPAEKNSLGRMRPAPKFTPASVSDTNKVKLRVVPEAVLQKEKGEAVSTPTAVPKQTTETMTAPEESPTVSEEEKVATTVSASTAPAAEYTNPMDRIKEIKRTVNLKVGNPVSLIDAHNEIGRGYMNALLSAMKAANGGTATEVNVAMQTLEKSFAQIQELDMSKDTQEQAEIEKNEGAASQQPPATEKEEVLKEETETPVDTPTIPSPVIPPVSVATPDVDTQAGVIPDVSVQPVSASSETASQPIEENIAPTPASEKKEVSITSVRKEKQIQELMQSNRIEEVQNQKKLKEEQIASMDPLMVPDVSSGLQQLLSEWSLFKSSGIFGTGPSGVDHPLYKKLSVLTMAAVIAGRFEGATPQIKQSITDYMNGWRYEEGVVHIHTETFEHYLRRVIKQILDKQKISS